MSKYSLKSLPTCNHRISCGSQKTKMHASTAFRTTKGRQFSLPLPLPLIVQTTVLYVSSSLLSTLVFYSKITFQKPVPVHDHFPKFNHSVMISWRTYMVYVHISKYIYNMVYIYIPWHIYNIIYITWYTDISWYIYKTLYIYHIMLHHALNNISVWIKINFIR